MNKKNGFTLVEVLAVISILGLLAVLLVPTMLNAYKHSKSILKDYEIKDIKDSGLMYLKDLDSGTVKYAITEDDIKNIKELGEGFDVAYESDSTILINKNKYNLGDPLTVYDFKTFAMIMNGIEVSTYDLVESGYFDDDCKYNEIDDNSDDQDCNVTADIMLKLQLIRDDTNTKYYVTEDYDVCIENYEDDCK